jgi:hypothetical protein
MIFLSLKNDVNVPSKSKKKKKYVLKVTDEGSGSASRSISQSRGIDPRIRNKISWILYTGAFT